jgi:hypothetical protein
VVLLWKGFLHAVVVGDLLRLRIHEAAAAATQRFLAQAAYDRCIQSPSPPMFVVINDNTRVIIIPSYYKRATMCVGQLMMERE